MVTNMYPSENCWHVARRPHDHCAIVLGLPQDDRPISLRFYGPCKGIVWQPCGLLTTIARVYDHFWTIWIRALSSRSPVLVRGSYDVPAMCLRAYDFFFSNLSLCGVKQNRRGHDICKSVRWSQGLPAEAARKRWFGHRTGIVYSSEGKCNRSIRKLPCEISNFCVLATILGKILGTSKTHLSPTPIPSGLGCCLFYDGEPVVVDSLGFYLPLLVRVLCLVFVLICITLCLF